MYIYLKNGFKIFGSFLENEKGSSLDTSKTSKITNNIVLNNK